MIYDHVFLIGVDGAGAFFKNADTPNLDYIEKNSPVSFTHNGRTAYPSISAECWGAMLLGVTPEAHGFTNSYISDEAHIRTGDVSLPSVFKLTRDKYPNARLVSYSEWNPINIGIVEDDIGVEKKSGGTAELTKFIVDSINSAEIPKLLFVQYDCVDGAGHHFGYGTKQYYDSISLIDSCIGVIWNTLRMRGALGNTLLIVTSDHGGTPGGGHGGDTPEEMTIYCGIYGKSVKNETIPELDVWDIPHIVGHALGLEAPQSWVGRLPENIF